MYTHKPFARKRPASPTGSPAGDGGAKKSHQNIGMTSEFSGKLMDCVDINRISRDKLYDGQWLEGLIGEKLGAVRIVGYHVTLQENLPSLRAEGFSVQRHTGRAGGVAGKNIRGPGLYLTTRPSQDYAPPDKYSVVLAAVVPAGLTLTASRRTYRPWDDDGVLDDPADYIQVSNEVKINPSSISKVGLVPVYHFPPRMNVETLIKPAAAISTADPALLSDWVMEKLRVETLLKQEGEIVESENDPDKKLDKINALANTLLTSFSPPTGVTRRQLLLHLKEKWGLKRPG